MIQCDVTQEDNRRGVGSGTIGIRFVYYYSARANKFPSVAVGVQHKAKSGSRMNPIFFINDLPAAVLPMQE